MLIKIAQNGDKGSYILDPSEETIKYLKQKRMKTYIGVKMIAAIAMTLVEFKSSKGEDITDLQDKDGYKVDYGDYQSWSPKDVFEAAYFPIEDKTKITRDDITNFIVEGKSHKLGDKTCVVLDSTITGFDTIGTSACVDPANYNPEIGAEIARKDIVNAIWGHLGFVLQWAKNGLKPKVVAKEGTL